MRSHHRWRPRSPHRCPLPCPSPRRSRCRGGPALRRPIRCRVTRHQTWLFSRSRQSTEIFFINYKKVINFCRKFENIAIFEEDLSFTEKW